MSSSPAATPALRIRPRWTAELATAAVAVGVLTVALRFARPWFPLAMTALAALTAARAASPVLWTDGRRAGWSLAGLLRRSVALDAVAELRVVDVGHWWTRRTTPRLLFLAADGACLGAADLSAVRSEDRTRFADTLARPLVYAGPMPAGRLRTTFPGAISLWDAHGLGALMLASIAVLLSVATAAIVDALVH